MINKKGKVCNDKIFKMSGGGRSVAPSNVFTDLCKVFVSCQKARLGFTLAEVLVTLGIIGVVSAMTVPTLMQNHQRKTYVTQLHKVYNELQQAFIQYTNDRNAINLKEAGLNSKAAVKNFFNEYFKVIHECNGIVDPCFSTSYKNINGEDVEISGGWGYGNCAVIASGSSICMDYPFSYSNSYGKVFIDINGSQGPNILGRDAFYLAVFYDGVLDVSGADINCRTTGVCGTEGKSLKDIRGTAANCKATVSTTDSCFGQILNDNWEMTY